MLRFPHHLHETCLALALFAGALGCAGGTSSTGKGADEAHPVIASPAAGQAGQEDEEAKRQAALERLRVRQEAACEQVGDVLFRCAVEDARATMSPEELAELDVAALEPRYKSEFMGQCLASDMSLRQVEIYEGCPAETDCAAFVACLDQARPQPQQ